MKRKPKPCLPELLNFCRQELTAIRFQMDESLEHLIREETLAALGAWDGLERRLAFAGNVLQLIARLSPNPARATKEGHESNNQFHKGG